MVKSVLLIGGDNRHRIMAELLTQKGYSVLCYGMDGCINLSKQATIVDKVFPADVTILPIPLTRDGIRINATYATREFSLEQVLSELHADTIVCGGMISQEVADKLHSKGIQTYDYAKSEEFALLNAIPSAEGAIEIALRNTPFILDGARVCVVGYGRIGKVLTKKLMGLGCNVTATARKQADIYAIEKVGAKPAETGALALQGDFDVIFNTVPAPVIDKRVLDQQTPQTLIIDLASKPGGVDFDYAQEKKITCIHALSLPARCAPISAAKIILTTIGQFLPETE